MKIVYLFLFIIVAASMQSCKKDSFITSSSASVYLSIDTLNFDTVFNGTGSVTQYFKIFNNNNQKLRINEVKLMGGTSSYFKLNLDGSPGTSFAGVEMDANDSLYGFVTVNIAQTPSNTPFAFHDSIRITYNGDTTYLQLVAAGQKANLLKNTVITKDTTWTNTLPIVIGGNGVTVNEGVTLTIEQGTKVYLGAHAPIMVNGTLKALGSADSSKQISFLSDRLDEPYNSLPGSWPGIFFSSTSSNNLLQYCNISNANEGVSVAAQVSNIGVMLTLNQCVFNNIKDIAIGGTNSSIAATNCLVSNSGNNVVLSSGGNYSFNYCTIVGYDNSSVSHTNPVMSISNTDSSGKVYNLNCSVTNSIIYGVSGIVGDELVINKKDPITNYNVSFTNTLYKAQDAIKALATFTTCLSNQSPMFENVKVDSSFNFKLQESSPCIKAGISNSVTIDLLGNARPSIPDIGCYQRK